MPPKKKPQPPVHVLPTPAKSKEVPPPKSVSSVDETPRTKLAAGKAKSTVTGADLGGGGGLWGLKPPPLLGYHLLQKSLYVFVITNLYPLCTC